jgi:hypothetical protein
MAGSPKCERLPRTTNCAPESGSLHEPLGRAASGRQSPRAYRRRSGRPAPGWRLSSWKDFGGDEQRCVTPLAGRTGQGRTAARALVRRANPLLGLTPPSEEEPLRDAMQRLRRTGSTAPAKIGGYRRPLLEPHADALREMVSQKKGITLREIRAQLVARGVEVNALSTIADMLHRLGLSHKKSR